MRQQEAGGTARDRAREALSARVRAMCAPEGVVHVDGGESSERCHERRIVRGLASVEAQVLEQQGLAVCERAHHGLHLGAYTVRSEG